MGLRDSTELKQRVLQLSQQRNAVEADIAALSARLQGLGQPGLSGGLLDEEGFPRADIDIPRVRADRHRLAVLHTDHKLLTAQIEQALHALHESARQTPRHADKPAELPSTSSAADRVPTPPCAVATVGAKPVPETALAGPLSTPFAVIDEVTPGSPAEADGIRVGDYLVVFGAVSVATRGSAVAAVAAELQRRRGEEVSVSLLRSGELLRVAVRPREWSGRGLLGCRMLSLANNTSASPVARS